MTGYDSGWSFTFRLGASVWRVASSSCCEVGRFFKVSGLGYEAVMESQADITAWGLHDCSVLNVSMVVESRSPFHGVGAILYEPIRRQ